MNVRVEVTSEAIASGVPSFPSFCPIALALAPHLRKGLTAFVEEDFALIYGTGPHPLGEIELPKKAGAFVAAFDDCRPVKPFTFRVDVPAEYLREACP